MKQIMRCMCLVLAITIFFALPTAAFENTDPRASNFFGYTSAYLYETSSTEFEVWFEVTAVGIMDELGVSTIKVQRSSNGENWETMQTYYKADYSQMICENTGGHASCVTYSGRQSGYDYRAYVTFYAKDNGNTAYYYCYAHFL